ncbi:KICSTOR complex protein SZT2-like isoform X3 [Artemia franciscana]|uniref:KICSTOR complex protein SZT2-like isoform X3 n=1 Tax=Artemia franciscana TaxID=6661 RepID=UPI0032DAC4DD
METLEAEQIFLVIGRHVNPSHLRNADWLMAHINTPLRYKRFERMEDIKEEIQLVSAIPVSPPEEWDYDTAHEYEYLINENTFIQIFAQAYSVAFCLDISPSMSAVVKPLTSDSDEVPLDRIYSSLKACLQGLTRHFIVPGSNLILYPDIYVSVLVHVPFARAGNRQALVQGWLLSEDDLDNFLSYIGNKLCEVEDSTARLTAAAYRQKEIMTSQYGRMVGSLFDGEDSISSEPVCGLSNPEQGLLDILRYCLLGFQMVPNYCCPAVIVISDDVFGFSKSDVMDSFLSQLRLSWVACSFIGLGSEVRPNLAFGEIPYKKLMCFVAATTGGMYLPTAPVVEVNDFTLTPNECHLSFLRRSFQMNASNELLIKSSIFAIERWKDSEYRLELDVCHLLACRLKEGFFLKGFSIKDDNRIQLDLALLWRTDITIEYVIKSAFPDDSSGVMCEIYVVGPYEFLHDITCKAKKPIRSPYRLTTFHQYWQLVKNLKETGQELQQLHQFTKDSAHYTVPEGVKSGIPLLYVPQNTLLPTFYSSDEEERSPKWFYVIRLASKPPYIVMKIGFLFGTPYVVRTKVLEDLKNCIGSTSVPQHPNYKDQKVRSRHSSVREGLVLEGKLEHKCCHIMTKSLEKILIKTDKQLKSHINTRRLQPGSSRNLRSNQSRNESLSRFLEKRHWVWKMQSDEKCSLDEASIGRILAVLIKLRLSEGFRFAVCSDGVITMALELSMKIDKPNWKKSTSAEDDVSVCLVQYVLFPPQTVKRRDSLSDEDVLNSTRDDYYLSRPSSYMITECWIEPQYGRVFNHDMFQYMTFDEIPDKIHLRDLDCVTTLATMDYLLMMSLDNATLSPNPVNVSQMNCSSASVVEKDPSLLSFDDELSEVSLDKLLRDPSIRELPFPYSLKNLFEKADVAELIFSSLTQELFPGVADISNSLESQESFPNENLYELFNKRLSGAAYREILLSGVESQVLFDFIYGLERKGNQKCPLTFIRNDLYSEPEIPRWRCYFRNVGGNKLILICLPKTLHDVKMLMVNSETVADENGFVFKVLQNSEEDESRGDLNTVDADDIPQTSSRRSSMANTPQVLSDDLSEAHDNGVGYYRRRFGSLDVGHQMAFEKSSTFRKRTFSEAPHLNHYDSSKGCHFINPVPILTHEGSYGIFKSEMIGRSVLKNRSELVGSFAIPVYVFELCRNEIVSQILEEISFGNRTCIFRDSTFSYSISAPPGDLTRRRRSETSNAREECDSKLPSPDMNSEETENSGDKLGIETVCRNIEVAFPRCYIESIFVALQQQLKTYSRDVVTAVDLCEETVVEIDITELLMKICRHFGSLSQMIFELNRSPEDENAHEPSASLKSEAERVGCCVLPLNREIQQRFNEILSYSFQIVKSCPDYFYFCSPDYQPSKLTSSGIEDITAAIGSQKGISFDLTRDEITKAEGNEDWIEFERDDKALESSLSIASDESNADSDSPIGDDDIVGEEASSVEGSSSLSTRFERICPLFLHLMSTVRVNGDQRSLSVSSLPACVCELITGLYDLDPSADPFSVKITLDILCLSPPISDSWQNNSPSQHTLSFSSSDSVERQSNLSEGEVLTEMYNLSHEEYCPDGVYIPRTTRLDPAILKMVDEIRWMVKDELVGLLLTSPIVTEDILRTVINHVETSPGRPSCYKDVEPLKFVIGFERSFELFKQEFRQLRLDRYGLKQEQGYFYVIQVDEEALHEEQEYKYEDLLVDQQQVDAILDELKIPCPLRKISANSLFDITAKETAAATSFEEQIMIPDGRFKLPPFWMAFQIRGKSVVSFFHCRAPQSTPIEFRSFEQTRKAILKKVEYACEFVNRHMLLKNLHDTRKCNNLLETDGEVTLSEGTTRSVSMDLDLADENHKTILAAEMKFNPGCFSCPVVWETHFSLHKKLKSGRGQTSRGLQALMMALAPFNVLNRKNMYVYQDGTDIFYMRLFECTIPEAEMVSVARFQVTSVSPEPRMKMVTAGNNPQESVGDFSQNVDVREPHGDCIRLLVHGITEAGPAIKNALTELLKNRLDEAVLSNLYRLLARNPQRKLDPEDVAFLQSEGEQPSKKYQFTLPSVALPFTGPLEYYLMESLSSYFTPPKYVDAQGDYRFKDYSPDPVPESHMLMHVRTPEMSQSWIGIVGFTFVDEYGNPLSSQERLNLHGCRMPSDMAEMEEFVKTELLLEKEEENYKGSGALIEFRLWERGTRNEDRLVQLFTSCIQHALWDLFMENNMLVHPLCNQSENQFPAVAVSETETPVQGLQHDFADPRARSVSFGGPMTYVSHAAEQSGSQANVVKSRHTSGLTDVTTVGAQSQVRFRVFSHSVPDLKQKTPRRLFKTSSAESSSKSAANLLRNKTRFGSRPLSPASFENDPNSCLSITSASNEPPLAAYELGEKGILDVAYGTNMKNWLDIAIKYDIPSVKSQVFDISSEHLIPVITKTFQGMIGQSHQGLTLRPFWNQSATLDFFVPFALSCSSQRCLNSKHILIARPTELWKECLKTLGNQDPDVIKSYKSLLKYQPFIWEKLRNSSGEVKLSDSSSQASIGTSKNSGLNLQFYPYESSDIFVPRQALIWALIENKKFTLYAYNVSKDLFQETRKLLKWENTRWLLFISLVEQKLGIFHNLPLTVRRDPQNPYNQCDPETLVRTQLTTARDFPSDKRYQFRHRLEAYRDRQPPNLLWKTSYKNDPDPVRRFGTQMLETKAGDMSEIFQRVEALWKSAITTDLTVSEDVIQSLLLHGRVIHYCYTPFLFLPKWRMQVAATRDPYLATLYADELIEQGPRSRASSGSQSECGAAGRRMTDDKWHDTLCVAFVQDYVYYLEHVLGFTRMDIQQRPPSKSFGDVISSRVSDKVESSKPGRSKGKVGGGPIYLKKSLQAGIIICEIEVKSPFFSTKLVIFESSRFKGSRPFVNFNVFQKFADECDQIKVLLHVHSFAYDYHLRCVQMYANGKQSPIKQGYHLISFLDDFTKYYNKGPNFARNLVYAGTLIFDEPSLAARQLYDYILDHERNYGFKVLRMSPLDANGETEYILVRTLTNVAFRSMHEQRNVPDYDATFIVSFSRSEASSRSPHILELKFYVILVTRRELYPKSAVELQEDRFKPVSTVSQPSSQRSSSERESEVSSKLSKRKTENEIRISDREEGTKLTVQKFGIRQESINYLGYYSGHEQLLQAAIQEQARNFELLLKQELKNARVHCRRDLLWQRLFSWPGKEAESRKESGLSFTEFQEMMNLSSIVEIDAFDPSLKHFLTQPYSFYQGLSKLITNRYAERCRAYSSETVQYTVLLSQKDQNWFTCMVVAVDLKRPTIFNLSRDSDGMVVIAKNKIERTSQRDALIKEFVNLCCFHTWTGLLG